MVSTRRGFLKGTGAAIGGPVIAGCSAYRESNPEIRELVYDKDYTSRWIQLPAGNVEWPLLSIPEESLRLHDINLTGTDARTEKVFVRWDAWAQPAGDEKYLRPGIEAALLTTEEVGTFEPEYHPQYTALHATDITDHTVRDGIVYLDDFRLAFDNSDRGTGRVQDITDIYEDALYTFRCRAWEYG